MYKLIIKYYEFEKYILNFFFFVVHTHTMEANLVFLEIITVLKKKNYKYIYLKMTGF
jgi:hypothetical protein